VKQLKVLLVGVGTVGEAIAKLSADAPWLDKMVLADYDVERARLVQARLGEDRRTRRRPPGSPRPSSTPGSLSW